MHELNLILVFLWLLVLPCSFKEDILHLRETCQWKSTILHVDADGGIHKVRRVNIRNTRVKIQKNSGLLDEKAFDYFAKNGVLVTYRNMIQLSIHCGGVYSPSSALLVAEEDFTVYIHVSNSHLSREGTHRGTTQNTFESYLTDVSALNRSKASCKTLLCEPVWVAPLPVYDKDLYLEINVEEYPKNLFSTPHREIITLDPFCGELCNFGESVPFDANVSSSLNSKGYQRFATTASFSVMDILSLDTSAVLFSDDQWTTVEAIKPSFHGVELDIDVCRTTATPPKEIIIYSAATANSKVYFATNVGLVEMTIIGNNKLFFSVVLKRCIDRLKVDSRDYNQETRLLAFNGSTVYYPVRSNISRRVAFEIVDTSAVCSSSNCEVTDASYDGVLSSLLNVLVRKTTTAGRMPTVYQVWSFSLIDNVEPTLVLEFENYLVKSAHSTRHALFTRELEEEMRLHQLTGSRNSSALCTDCYVKEEITVDHITSHSLSHNNLILLGTHIIYGVLGGKFYSLSSADVRANYTLVAADQGGLLAFYSSSPYKQVLLWIVQTEEVRQIYPSHGWHRVAKKSQSSKPYVDLLALHDVISMSFILSGQLLILLTNKNSARPSKSLLKVEVQVGDVIMWDDADADLFAGSEALHENELHHNHRCNYQTRVDNSKLLQYVRAQYYEWHMFPVPRAAGLFHHTLSSVLTNQLLVYNILQRTTHTSDLSNVSHASSDYLSAVGHNDNQTSYSFGVRHSSALERHDHRHSHQYFTLPSPVYIDKLAQMNFTVSIAIDNRIATLQAIDDLSKIQLSLELSINDIIEVDVTRTPDYLKNAMKHQVVLTLNDSYTAVQQPPGVGLQELTLTMRVTTLDLQCASSGHTFHGLHSMQIFIGCPPQIVSSFDLNRSIEQLQVLQTHLNCLNRPEYENCFYFQHTFYPNFKVHYLNTGESVPFRGKYTLKVVGGGNTYNKMRKFTPDEIELYNSFNQSTSRPDTLMITPERLYPKETHNGFPVYDHENNAIYWQCDAKSDCASPPPADGGIPEYFFLLEFSNLDVDTTTNCRFEFQFVVRVFGYKIGQQDYAVLLGTMLVMTTHVILFYFWKTRYYWLALLHHKESPAIKKMLSFGKLADVASQASLKKTLLEAIYTDNHVMISQALSKGKTSVSDRMGSSIDKAELKEALKKRLEQQIKEHDIRGMGITVGEMTKHDLFVDTDKTNIMNKARQILAKKAMVVLKLIDSLKSGNYRDVADALESYQQLNPEDKAENNPLVRQAIENLTRLLSKQLLKSLKKRDLWELHYASKEFRKHNIVDKHGLLVKAENAIYNRITTKIRKASKQPTPQLLRDAIADAERDLEFHSIPDHEGLVNTAKIQLYKMLKEKLAEEMRRKDSTKIRNAINKFAFYGVVDASGFLEKANKNLYAIVITPMTKSLEQAKTAEEIHRVIVQLRNELDKYGLQDMDNVMPRAEKMLYDEISKQLQAAIKSKAKPKDLAIILAAFKLSKKQYKVSNDLRKLEDTGKSLLYQQLVPFLKKALNEPNIEPKQLSAAIIAARVEFSRSGVEDPGDIIQRAEKKLYDLTFGPLREMLQYSKDSKALWAKIKTAQNSVRDFAIVDTDDLLMKADEKFCEQMREDIEEAMIKRDAAALKNMRDFFKLLSHPQKFEFIQLIDRYSREVANQLGRMTLHLQQNMSVYQNLCEQLRHSITEVTASQNIRSLLPLIAKFQASEFPDRDGVYALALKTVADAIQQLFERYMDAENYANVALLGEDVAAAALDPKLKDQYCLLSIVCGKYLTIKTDIELTMVDRSTSTSSHIHSLEAAIHNVKSLKLSMPPTFTESLTVLHQRLNYLIEKAGEMNAFLTSIEEIKSDLANINPVDIVGFHKYNIVPSRVFDILRAFLLVLKRDYDTVERWCDIRKELSGYHQVAGLLASIRKYSPVTSNMLNILEARELCDPYLDLINIDEESSNEHTTLAVILKWVLLMINESTVHFTNSGADLQKVAAEFREHKRSRDKGEGITEVTKDTFVNGKVVNPTELALANMLLKDCLSIIRPEWTSAYIIRWIKAYSLDTAKLYLQDSVQLKTSIKAWKIYHRYAAPEVLLKYGSIIEHTGVDKSGNAVFLCAFDKIDFNGLARSVTSTQFMLHMIYLLEMVEHMTQEEGYRSTLIIDCAMFIYNIDSKTMEGFGWFHAFIILIRRAYPALFRNVYVLHGSRYNKLTDRFHLLLFESTKSFNTQMLEGDSCRELLSTFIDKESLPPSLHGYTGFNSISLTLRIPQHFHLEESDTKELTHQKSTLVDAYQPKVLRFQQSQKSTGAILYCEFKPDGPIDFEVYYLPSNRRELINKTVVLAIAGVDHFYANHLDASKPGTYHAAFTNSSSRSKRLVTYQAGIANNAEDMKKFVYKIVADDDGNIINRNDSKTSFFLI